MKNLNKLVIDKIAPYWKKVADSLEFDIPLIRSIEKRCLKDDYECCDGVLRDWISSDHGLQPKTWKTFIAALQFKILKNLQNFPLKLKDNYRVSKHVS